MSVTTRGKYRLDSMGISVATLRIDGGAMRKQETTDSLRAMLALLIEPTEKELLRWTCEAGTFFRYVTYNNRLLVLGPDTAHDLDRGIRHLLMTPLHSPGIVEIISNDAELCTQVRDLARAAEPATLHGPVVDNLLFPAAFSMQ